MRNWYSALVLVLAFGTAAAAQEKADVRLEARSAPLLSVSLQKDQQNSQSEQHSSAKREDGKDSKSKTSDGNKSGAPAPPKSAGEGDQSAKPAQERPAEVRFHSDPSKRGARDLLNGRITDVQCSKPTAMKLTFVSGKIKISLYTEDYYSVEYDALNYTPTEEILPCKDLKGMRAKIIFYDLKGRPDDGELISVQLRK
jgi:hypothetical protein